MNDKELLELAAKAAGMPRPVDDNGVWSTWVGTPENGHWWDPLTDDGDAFRLAVRLEMVIDFEEREIFYFCPKTKTREKVHYYAGEDKYGIVRAAANIGSSKP